MSAPLPRRRWLASPALRSPSWIAASANHTNGIGHRTTDQRSTRQKSRPSMRSARHSTTWLLARFTERLHVWTKPLTSERGCWTSTLLVSRSKLCSTHVATAASRPLPLWPQHAAVGLRTQRRRRSSGRRPTRAATTSVAAPPTARGAVCFDDEARWYVHGDHHAVGRRRDIPACNDDHDRREVSSVRMPSPLRCPSSVRARFVMAATGSISSLATADEHPNAGG